MRRPRPEPLAVTRQSGLSGIASLGQYTHASRQRLPAELGAAVKGDSSPTAFVRHEGEYQADLDLPACGVPVFSDSLIKSPLSH
jgi:hypothetical protein